MAKLASLVNLTVSRECAGSHTRTIERTVLEKTPSFAVAFLGAMRSLSCLFFLFMSLIWLIVLSINLFLLATLYKVSDRRQLQH